MFTLKQLLFKCNNLRKFRTSSVFKTELNDNIVEILNEDREYLTLTENYLNIKQTHICYIIQPYVKWGPQKLQGITPNEQLDEAKALINTLPEWKVADAIAVPLETLDLKTVFKSGSMEKLRNKIRSSPTISAVLVNLGNLKRIQALNLEKEFGVPIFDRYKIVMQILKIHATSKHAKLQVALAELYYLRKTAMNELFTTTNKETFKLMFQNREQKLKNALKELRKHRHLLRSNRKKIDYPVIAVVGYTNAGKTSIIKALTGEDNLQPRNQLFATLDVTLHSGILPSGLEVLYIDTVGFISDIPTTLIECFVATLEDAVLADLILHVEDLSSSCFEFKREHVLKTLQNLGSQTETDVMQKIISVGNKCDLVINDKFGDLMKVSAQTDVGLDALRLELEKNVVKITNRQRLKVKLPAGGEELRWLYKNATVINEVPNETNESIFVSVIITNSKLQQFKHYFMK